MQLLRHLDRIPLLVYVLQCYIDMGCCNKHQHVAILCEVQASEIDPDSPEPEQALASLRHELGDLDEALQLLRSSMHKWWRPDRDEQPCKEDKDSCQSGGRRPGNNEMQSCDSDAESSDGQLPSYEFRLEACKLLIELDTSTDVAVEVRGAVVLHVRIVHHPATFSERCCIAPSLPGHRRASRKIQQRAWLLRALREQRDHPQLRV